MKWSSREYLIGFNMVQGIAGHRLSALLRKFGSLEKAWHSSYNDLITVPGFGPRLAQSFLDQRARICPLEEIKWATNLGARILTYYDLDYPEYLQILLPLPPVIYYLGSLPKRLGIGIVGTRKPTSSGRQQAYVFARDLATTQTPIVSGLARGIDTQAHLGALAAGGFTVAILGSPLNKIYPPENKGLAQRIAKEGCLITEFSSLSSTKPGNFPRRNRLISAFSQGILVVEASEKSGTSSTVDSALEQGKDVWAIPGDIGHPLRKGTNNLIKQGAGLVDSPQDIIEYLNLEFNNYLGKKLDQTSKLVLKYYRQGFSTNEIVEVTQIPVQEVQSCLTLLQLEGY